MIKQLAFARTQDRRGNAKHAQRKEQVGTGERNERIRTYNFPQNRLTDHRIDPVSLHLPAAGEIDQIIDPLMANYLEEKWRR